MERFAFWFTRLRMLMFCAVSLTLAAGKAGTLHSFGRRWQKSSQPYGTLVLPPTVAELAAGRVDASLTSDDCAAAGPTCSDETPTNEMKPRRREEVETPGDRFTANTTATRRLATG